MKDSDTRANASLCCSDSDQIIINRKKWKEKFLIPVNLNERSPVFTLGPQLGPGTYDAGSLGPWEPACC